MPRISTIPFAFQAAASLPARLAAHILLCMLRCSSSPVPSRNLKCFGYIVAKFLAISSVVITTTSLVGCVNQTAPAGVATGTVINLDRRTAGTIVDDQAIAIKANLAISKDKNLWRHSHINTLSYNGSLLLVGQTIDYDLKDKVDDLLADVPEIEKIYNQITVGPVTSYSVRMNDTWITTQIKAKIIGSRDIGLSRVNVITEDGKVYLMGILTKDEAEIVTDLVRKVKGVEEVVTIFDRFDRLG